MRILVLNCGSSSAKYKLFEMAGPGAQGPREVILGSGVVEEVGLGEPRLSHRRPGRVLIERSGLDVHDHREAIRLVLDVLCAPDCGVLRTVEEIEAVGHRVVHGGEQFACSARITPKVMRALHDNAPLAPLHNPPNIQGIEAIRAHLPHVPQVAVFDTAFHQTMEPPAYLYAIPYRYYVEYGIRRYGFHGTSHRYVAQQAAGYLGRPLEELRVVTCHLGNGASVTAVLHGRSIMTSMGFTPLAGLAMGTRSGDLDPAIIPFLMQKDKLSPTEIYRVLNHESGLLGLSGVSNDVRVLGAAIHTGQEHPDYERSLLALKHYTLRVKKTIGAYAALMGGLDCIVFTGGIGENSREVCEWSCEGLEFLGVRTVRARRPEGSIVEATGPDSPTKVLIVPTDEELAIARDTLQIVSSGSQGLEDR